MRPSFPKVATPSRLQVKEAIDTGDVFPNNSTTTSGVPAADCEVSGNLVVDVRHSSFLISETPKREVDDGVVNRTPIAKATTSTASTPPPVEVHRVLDDVAPRSVSSLAIPSSRRVVYDRKARKHKHPLDEPTSLLDAWPAPRPVRSDQTIVTSTSVAPQFLADVCKEITRKLNRLTQGYRHLAGRYNNSMPTYDESGDPVPPDALLPSSRRQRSGNTRTSPRDRGSSGNSHQQATAIADHAGMQLVAVSAELVSTSGGGGGAAATALGTTTAAVPPITNQRALRVDSPPSRATDHPKRKLAPLTVSPKPTYRSHVSKLGAPTQPPPQSSSGVTPIPKRPTPQDVRQQARAMINESPLLSLVSSTFVSPAGSPMAAAHSQSSSPQIPPRLERRKSQLNQSVRTPEDVYRTERMAIFRAACLDFANHFSTYRHLLLWIFQEWDDYERYCHKNVVSPEMRAQYEVDLQEELQREFADERAKLQFEIATLREALQDVQKKYQASRSLSLSCDKLLAEKDAQLSQMQAEVEDNAKGRAALLSRITRLEKELWEQRDAREGPERIINQLRKEVKSLEERFAFASKALEESNQDKAILKVRLERLEDMLKERKMKQAQTVPKSELLLYKKAQIDVLEFNANLEARLIKLRGAQRSAVDELERLRDRNAPTTPRPPWHIADDIFPKATTTAQRVHLAMREYRLMLHNNQQLLKEVEELHRAVAMMPRGEDNADSEYILPEMQVKYFYKLGFDASVPSYLRGNGRAENLKLTMEATAGLCRLLFLHRDTAGRRGSASPDTVFETFCQKYTPPNVSAQDFAYSLHHAMRWYSFDTFIGFMRQFVAGQLDDTVLIHLEKIIFGCKLFIQNAADEMKLGQAGEGAAGAAKTADGADDEHQSFETIRRKSLAATLVASAENSAGQAMGTTGLSFTAQVQLAEEPRLLYKGEILPLIAEFFCQRSEEELKALVAQLNVDFPAVQVDSRGLFRFNAAKRRFTAFVEEVIRQELRIQRELRLEYTLAVQSTTNSEGHVTPAAIAASLWKMDPLIVATYMDELLSDMFEVSLEDLRPSLVEGSFYKTPGLDGERCYATNSDDPVMAEEAQVVRCLKRRILLRFCPKSEVETEALRLKKEAERAKERAELDGL